MQRCIGREWFAIRLDIRYWVFIRRIPNSISNSEYAIPVYWQVNIPLL